MYICTERSSFWLCWGLLFACLNFFLSLKFFMKLQMFVVSGNYKGNWVFFSARVEGWKFILASFFLFLFFLWMEIHELFFPIFAGSSFSYYIQIWWDTINTTIHIPYTHAMDILFCSINEFFSFLFSIIVLKKKYICVVAGAETLMQKWEIYRINVWTVIKSSFNINLIFFCVLFFLCYIGWIRWIQKSTYML